MKSQKSAGSNLSAESETVDGSESQPQETKVDGFRTLLREFFAWQKKRDGEPPPVSEADVDRAKRIIEHPTEEERAFGLEAAERALRRRGDLPPDD
jgi:hypothetical protein